jgi:hypothetical protein
MTKWMNVALWTVSHMAVILECCVTRSILLGLSGQISRVSPHFTQPPSYDLDTMPTSPNLRTVSSGPTVRSKGLRLNQPHTAAFARNVNPTKLINVSWE